MFFVQNDQINLIIYILAVLCQFPLGFMRKRCSQKEKMFFTYILICITSILFEICAVEYHPIFGIFGLFSHIIGNRLCAFGLTGSIGAGKSTLSSFLMRNGFVIIDADAIAHEILEVGRPAYKKLVKEFSCKILNHEDKTINRQILRGIAFEDTKKYKTLNRITHYYIIKTILWRIFKFKLLQWKDYVVIDAPLMYETKLNWLCSPIILVHVDEAVQCERILHRDASISIDVRKIIKAQMPSKEKAKYADIVFDNNQSVENLIHQAKEYFYHNYGLILH